VVENSIDLDIPRLPGLTEDQAELLMMSVGTHRTIRPLQPSEVAALFAKSIHNGSDTKTIGREIGLSKSMVDTFLRLMKLDETVLSTIGWRKADNRIPLWTAVQLTSLDRTNQLQLLNLILRDRLTSTEIRSILQLAKRSGISIPNAAVEIVQRRAVTVDTTVFMGSINKPTIVSALVRLSQNTRNVLLATILDEHFPHAGVTGTLGTTSFVLVHKGLEPLAEPEALSLMIEDALNTHIASNE